MSPRLRRLALTTHITSTVGWLGAIVGFLALAITALTSQEVQLVRGAYLAMELTGWYVLVPLCVASLLTRLIMSLGTPWGLFRHYWVLVKFVITILAAIILFMYTQTLEQLGALARDPVLSLNELQNPSFCQRCGDGYCAKSCENAHTCPQDCGGGTGTTAH